MVADINEKAPRLFVSITDAARESGASYEVVRRALVRLGAGHKDENGRVLVPIDLVRIFKSERQRSGYLHPRGAKLSDLAGDVVGPPEILQSPARICRAEKI